MLIDFSKFQQIFWQFVYIGFHPGMHAGSMVFNNSEGEQQILSLTLWHINGTARNLRFDEAGPGTHAGPKKLLKKE